MHVVIFPVNLHKNGLKVLAYLLENLFERGDMLGAKDFPSVFRHEDQMNVKVENTVPSCPNFA